VYGLEPDAAACDLAQQRGLPVVCATLEEAPWPDNTFDVVTFWHSLEHMAQPQRALAVAMRLLRPGGLCMIEVPNWASMQRMLFGRRWFHLDLPRHRAYFSRDCLSRYVLRAGFQELHVSAVASTVGVSGSLERMVVGSHSRGGFRHNRALKALAWLPEALLSPLGLAGCTLATARKP
jgi:SAM-dependent methyltransferase